MILRDYQEKMLNDARAALRNHRSVLIQSECGSGKGTVTAAMIHGARQRGKNVLFVVYGRDRVRDMDQRVTKLGIEHGVLMGGERREHWHGVQVASIDTLHRMRYKPKADIICIDECHGSMSPTYRAVLDYYEKAKIVGLSATPALASGRGLGVGTGGVFEVMVKGPTVNELIAQKHLVGSRLFAPPAPAEMKGLKKKKTGEFDNEQGAAMCDNPKVIGDVVDNWRRFGSDRKAAVFGFNQKHAFDIAESFRRAGINFAYVDADTPDGDIHTPFTRKFYWHQMEHGDLVGVASVNVISIGWDMPPAKYIALAAKTSSFPLYRQRLGRGSRPYKWFQDFIISDHCAGYAEFLDKGPFFESEIDWQLDGEAVRPPGEKDAAPRVATCKVPAKIPPQGIGSFTGPVRGDIMLPCYMTFAAGPSHCPYCGLALGRDRGIKVEAGQLAEIKKEEVLIKSPAQLALLARQKARYAELLREIAGKKKKDGTTWSLKAAKVRFADEFHFFPPDKWLAECQEMMVE